MPTAVPENYKLERRWSLTHFLIGVFGATAILGVMAKIFSFEAEIFGYLLTWKPVVLVGFMGEAFVFILMGMMREMQYVPVDEDSPSPTGGHDEDANEASGGAGARSQDPKLEKAEAKLAHEAEELARRIQSARENLAGELEVLDQLSTLQGDLKEVGDSLSGHSEALGENMEDLQDLYKAQSSIARSFQDAQQKLSEESEGLSEEIAETREAMRDLRKQFAHATRRLEQFNQPFSAGRSSEDGSSTGGTSADDPSANGSSTNRSSTNRSATNRSATNRSSANGSPASGPPTGGAPGSRDDQTTASSAASNSSSSAS